MWTLRKIAGFLSPPLLPLLFCLLGPTGCAGYSAGADTWDMGSSPPDLAEDVLPPVVFQSQSCPSGKGGSAVAVGHLNSDTRDDVVVSNGLDDTLSVYLNQGSEGCPTMTSYPTGRSPSALAIGDLSGDGFDEVVAATPGSSSVSVHLNNRDGTLMAAAAQPVASASALVLGDVDKRSGLDLAVLSSSDDAVTLFLNQGSGALSMSPTKYAGGRLLFSVGLGSLTPGLVNLILVSAGDDGLDLLTADAAGDFKSPLRLRPPELLTPVSLALSDLDQDGRPDLVVPSHNNDRVVILRNRGGLTFSDSSVAVGHHPLAVAIADLTGDGLPDLAVVNGDDDSLQIVVNQGQGQFATGARHRYPTAAQPTAIAAVDLNADGRLDLVMVHKSGDKLTLLTLR